MNPKLSDLPVALISAAAFVIIVAGIQAASATLEHFATITANVNHYMGLKALISMATGAIIWLLLALIGVEFAGTWGLLAFFLNFIPSIGSIIAAVPAIL